MQGRWSEEEAEQFVGQYAAEFGSDLALRAYSSRLLGGEKSLVLHGGGNTSVKGTFTNVFGQAVPAVFVKATGRDMASLEPADHVALDLDYLLRLRALGELSDEEMVNQFRTHLFDSTAPTPSIETLMHAFVPAKYVDHTHADAILALTNQPDGERLVREALGEDVIVVDYVKAGFKLAKAAADALDAKPRARGMVFAKHGLTTWGETARESYESMIELVSRAEGYLEKRGYVPTKAPQATTVETALERLATVAPVLRGLLARPKAEQDFDRFVLLPLIDDESLNLVDSERGRELALTPPLTPDHLIRTKVYPMWVGSPAYDDPDALREQLSKAVESYAAEYRAYLDRHASEMPAGVEPFDPLPRVVMMPGLGVLCAGKDAGAATIARDITAQSVAVKSRLAGIGSYEGLSEDDLFSMEYYSLQHAKLSREPELPLGGKVALVTGAAGAIGTGICRGLLAQGAHVVVTDLPGERFDEVFRELESQFPLRVTRVAMDVTDSASVRGAVEHAIRTWGGVDVLVHCAGVAHVAKLAELDAEAFRRLERINVEGTLNVLGEFARHFRLQGIGGDVIVVSTKNVFAPGAGFGAYSATKAAAHQLARIASLELAEIGVRVNMVSPDAVFSDGARRSGLWAEIGPDRMRARGLDEKGLEEYYRSRNLLKAAVTADHVANAVLFFATRQTPTTGATIPVDGGLPDATPR